MYYCHLLLLVLLALFNQTTFSQTNNTSAPNTIEISDITENARPGIKVSIPNGNIAEVTAHWKKYLKSLKGTTKTQKEGYFTDNASISQLSNNPVDVYSEVDSYTNGVVLKAFFDMGGAYLTTAAYPDKYPFAVTMLRDFAAHESSAAMKKQLTAEEKKLFLLSSERKELKKENEDIEQQLKQLKEAVKRAELSLSENKTAMEKKDTETNNQISKVEQLKKNIDAILLPVAPKK